MGAMNETPQVPTSRPLSNWVAELAQPTGVPGGGAASGVMLGLSAALLRMVSEYSSADRRASECSKRLVGMRLEALKVAEIDGTRSAEFGAALALSTDNPKRDDRVRDAAIDAARSSVVLGEVGGNLLAELRLLADIGSPQLRADLAVAAEALAAGLAGAHVNLRANLQTARRHGASQASVENLHTAVQTIGEYRLAAAEIAEQNARHFDG